MSDLHPNGYYQAPLPGLTQRWREHRSLYRPLGETIRTGDYEVALIETDAEPKKFCKTHHYSSSYVAARY